MVLAHSLDQARQSVKASNFAICTAVVVLNLEYLGTLKHHRRKHVTRDSRVIKSASTTHNLDDRHHRIVARKSQADCEIGEYRRKTGDANRYAQQPEYRNFANKGTNARHRRTIATCKKLRR